MAAINGNKTSGPFTLSRVTVEDMEELSQVEFNCFPPFIQEIAMGCRSIDDLPKIRAKYFESMKTDPSDIWIKIVDNESGKMVAGSNWKVYLNGAMEGKGKEPVLDWLDGELAEKSKRFIQPMEETRARLFKGVPFIHLHICFTDSNFRRRGAGSMMLKWGCEVADLLGLAGWIEASEEGQMLYKVHGFYEHSKVEGEVGGVYMKRDAKAWAITGGK